MSPFDNFAAPPVVDMGESLAYSAKKDSSTAANQGVNKVPSSFAKSEKKYVDVVVPQTTELFGDFANQKAVDEAIVPEFNAPSSGLPSLRDQVQLNPKPVVPQLDFLDMDDWTSPFDLNLDFDNILFEWDSSQSVFDPLHMEYGDSSVPQPADCSPMSEHTSLAVEQQFNSASMHQQHQQQSSQSSESELSEESETKVEEDEFTRNRRLCLERYREKKRNRKFSKKVRYVLRKMNADRRPRYKGRFIKKGEVIPKELLDQPKQK